MVPTSTRPNVSTPTFVSVNYRDTLYILVNAYKIEPSTRATYTGRELVSVCYAAMLSSSVAVALSWLPQTTV